LVSEFHSSALKVPTKSTPNHSTYFGWGETGAVTNDEGVFGEIFEETSSLCTLEVEVEGICGGKECEEGGEEEEDIHFAR